MEKLRPGYGYSRDLLCIHPLLSHQQSMAKVLQGCLPPQPLHPAEEVTFPVLLLPPMCCSSRSALVSGEGWGLLQSNFSPASWQQKEKALILYKAFDNTEGVQRVTRMRLYLSFQYRHFLQTYWTYLGPLMQPWKHGTQPRAHISQFCRPIRSVSWAMPCPDHQAESLTWSYPSAMWSQQFKPPFTKRTSKKSIHGAQERKS